MVAYVYSRGKPKRLDFRSEYHYRDYDDLASRKDCIFCAFILQHLGVSGGTPAEKYQWFSLHIFPTRDTSYLGVYGGNERPEVTSSFGWARGVFDLNSENYRRLETLGKGYTVAVDLVKNWLADCEAYHHHEQEDTLRKAVSSRNAQKADIYLVDVIGSRLVRADSAVRYVALSYVWGQQGTTVDNFETTQATLDRLLTSLGSISGMPTVVRDAMQFVGAVGERFLWVDRLCIVQDDAQNKHENISQMDKIYASAVFTIVASSGISGDVPLPGVRSGSRPPQVSEKAGGVCLKRGSQGRFFVLTNSVWNQRGWTFQEMHLSPRRVIFTPHEVFCECADTAVAELDLGEVMLDPEEANDPLLYLKDPNHELRTRDKVSTPDGQAERSHTAFGSALVAYRSLVREYCRRKLSFDSDILNAFTGILSYLASRTDWGFAFGLPADELGLALLWLSDDNAARRTVNDEAQTLTRDLPTWSWIGWRTTIFWLGPIEQIEPKDTNWTYEDRIKEYTLASEKHSQDSRPLPRDGELYPRSLLGSHVQSLLCFDAEVLPISQFTIPNFGPQLATLGPIKIMNATGVHCGSMFVTSLRDPSAFESLNPALSFVALSTFEFRAPPGRKADDFENGPPLFIRNKTASGNGKMVNGLLVREVGEIVERVAVFQIDSEVWAEGVHDSQSVLKTVFLG